MTDTCCGRIKQEDGSTVECGKPLGQESRDLDYRHCHDCRRCAKCGNDINSIYSRYCAEYGINPVQCHDCIDINPAVAEPARFDSTDKVTITRAEYDLLNIARRICTPIDSISIDTNMKDAEIANSQWIASWPHDKIIKHMRRMQSISAACMLVLKKAKTDIEKQEKLMDDLAGTEFTAAVTKEKTLRNKKIEQQAEQGLTPLERKRRRDRDKGIESLMTYSGLNQKDAEKAYDRQMAINKLMAQGVSRADAETRVDGPNWPPTIQ